MSCCANTLFVRHLPGSLTPEEQEEILKHFGALQVKCMPQRGQLRNSAFATYKSEEEAKHALGRLHQLEILGARLTVQFAKETQRKHFPHLADYPEPKFHATEGAVPQVVENDLPSKLEEFHNSINSISATFGLTYPISPKLRYHYPPPTPTTISNIAHAMIAVPKFYTQVLHLMNKMNLPAPFGSPTPAPPVRPDPTFLPMPEQQAMMRQVQMESTEESELESDDEAGVKKPKVGLPLKRPGTHAKRAQKRHKLQHLLVPAATSHKESAPVLPTEVFELPQEQVSKKIEFKLNPMEAVPTQLEMTATSDVVEGGFGQFAPPQSTNETDQNQGVPSNVSEFISKQELSRNKMSRDEMKRMPIFKNYDPGEPTTRLYIKNLSKQVEEKDLRYIYGAYVNMKSEADANMFDIRLMHEGRMKGQAFVNLPSEKKAQTALKDTNGYMLYGKPLVVHFARSAKPKEKDDQSKPGSRSSR